MPPPTFTPTVLVASPTVAPPTATPTSKVVVSPTSSPTSKPLAAATPTLAAGIPKLAEQLQLIKPEELKALIEGGADILVVDVQPKSIYDQEHIEGSVSFPQAMQINYTGNLPRDKLLILYCACAHEEDSSDVAMQLVNNFGYKSIMLLEGGWLRWKELGYPTEKGGK
jgi:rhodanese-related sulfurtransferase